MDAVELIVWIVPIGIPFFVISSVVLYIKNRIEAKETGQEINKIYKKLFSISIAIIVLFVVGILGMAIYLDPWMQKSKCSSDTQLADAVHTAVLTAMMDPEIKKKEEYPEDLAALSNEFDITKYTGDENCILEGALEVFQVEDLHELRGMTKSRGATGRILVTVYGPEQVQVVIEGTKSWVTGEVIAIR